MHARRPTAQQVQGQGYEQLPTERQDLVPYNVRDEYRITDEESIRDEDLNGIIGDAQEIDLNSRRNVVKPHTFWA